MKFIGYACRHSQQPLRRLFLPLSDFTVLLGRNDSGKSSLLRSIERDLSGGHYEKSTHEERSHVGAAFFLEADERELESLIRSVQGVREQARGANRGHLGDRPPWGMREWNANELPVLDHSDETPTTSWLEALREKADTGLKPALDALASSQVVSFEPAGFDRAERVWNVSWCLPSREHLSEEVEKGSRPISRGN